MRAAKWLAIVFLGAVLFIVAVGLLPPLSNMELYARGKGRALDVEPLAADLYGGTVSAKGKVDASGQRVSIQLEKHFRGVQVGALLAHAKGTHSLAGTGDFDVFIRSRGSNREELTANANGTTRFTLRDGAVKGINIVREICGQLTRSGVVASSDVSTDQTPFSNMSGTGQIRNGVLFNNDLSITSPLVRVSGAGNIQFLSERIGYAVTAHLVDSCQGQGRGILEDLVDVPIPIRISGPIANPRFGFDLDAVFESLAKKHLEKQGHRLLEKALGGDKIGRREKPEVDAIKGLLQGLFK